MVSRKKKLNYLFREEDEGQQRLDEMKKRKKKVNE